LWVVSDPEDKRGGLIEQARQTWLAWTEDGTDRLANRLRNAFDDKLLGLLAVRQRLAAAGDAAQIQRLDEFRAFEFGGEDEAFKAAGADPSKSLNKRAMKLLKDRADNGVKYLRPHEEILTVPGAKGVRVYALGPPRSQDQLEDLNPQGDEQFHLAVSTASAGNYFAAAVTAAAQHGQSPFSSRFALGQNVALNDQDFGTFSPTATAATGWCRRSHRTTPRGRPTTRSRTTRTGGGSTRSGCTRPSASPST
jgi:hypothetical protein